MRSTLTRYLRRLTGFLLVLLLFLTAGLASSSLASSLKIKLLTFNVKIENRDYARFSAFLTEENPDIVVLQEAREEWVEKSGLADFPYIKIGPRQLIMASRFPLLADETIDFAEMAGRKGYAQRSLIGLEGSAPSSAFALYNIHPTSPRMRQGFARQLKDFNAISAAIAQERPERTIVAAGDFNAVPTSPHLLDFLKNTGLTLFSHDSLSLPTRFDDSLGLPFRVGLPIDHVAGRGGVALTDRRIGPDLGSDHLPVIVELEMALPPPSRKSAHSLP